LEIEQFSFSYTKTGSLTVVGLPFGGSRLDSLFAIFGQLVLTILVATGAAWSVFVWLGKRWIEQKFSKDLEHFRQEQAKELEQLRHSINSAFSRISKIHDREFEVLPRIWRTVRRAHGAVLHLVSPLKEWPDFSSLPPDSFEEFMESSRLGSSARIRVKACENGKDRLSQYQAEIYWVDLHQAKKVVNSFQNYFVLNRIFIPDEIKAALEDFRILLHKSIISYEDGKDDGDRKLRREASKFVGEIDLKFAELERMIQKRLRYEEA